MRRKSLIFMKYARVYTDAAGETHFEDVDVETTLVDFAPPAGPLAVSKPLPATSALFVGPIEANWDGGWHPAPRRQLAVLLSSELEMEVSDGEVRVYGPGAVVLLDDTHGTGHAGRMRQVSTILFVPLSEPDSAD